MEHQQNIFTHLQAALIAASQTAGVFLMVLHADPASSFAGGTERQVRSLTQLLTKQQYAVFEMFPVKNHSVRFRSLTHSIDIIFHQDTLPDLILLLSAHVDVLHVHHLLGWGEKGQDALLRLQVPKKIITLHDYYFACPSINLLQAPDGLKFCGVERDLTICNKCLNQFHGYKKESIEVYRQEKIALLQQFDHILLPSRGMKTYFKAAFSAEWPSLEAKCIVLAHDLAPLVSLLSPSVKEVNKKLIVFIGALSAIKGAHLIVAAIPSLLLQGYTVEVWGRLYGLPRSLKKLVQRPYHDQQALQQLFAAHRPAYAVFASIAAETFSFTFFETLFLSNGAVPIVGQYGHPADMVREHNVGVVMDEMSAAGIVRGCQKAAEQYEVLRQNQLNWMRETQVDYTQQYKQIINLRVVQKTKDVFLDLQEIHLLDAQRQLFAKRREWRLLVRKIWSQVRTKWSRPHYMKQLISKGFYILKSEGINGIKNRLSRLG